MSNEGAPARARKPILIGEIENAMPVKKRTGVHLPPLPFDRLAVGQSLPVSGISRQTLRKLAAAFEQTNGSVLVVGSADEHGTVRIGRKA